jgi:hypothetical protein
MAKTNATIYERFVEADIRIDHHCSDLYVRNTPEAREILKRYPIHQNNSRGFKGTDGDSWIDVPFAYDPFWDSSAGAARG